MNPDINIQTDDKKLIESFLNGDKNAFNYIVLKYQKKIYWAVRKIVLDHNDADDVTQEVFIKLYSSLKDFRAESSLYTYIYKMAINYSINSFNKNKLKLSREKTIDENDHFAFAETPDYNSFDRDVRSEVFQQALKTLPDMQRTIFSMRYYDELTYDEIAKTLNKSVGGLKANYFHAFKKIQQFILNKQKEGYIDSYE